MTDYVKRVEDALAALKKGRMVIVADDERRENEGDLILAGEFATPEAINFMAKEARGLVCLALTETQIAKLNLPMMTENNQSAHRTAFTVSIEAAQGVTTGISAYDRAHTIQTAIADDAKPEDVVVPGHIFPLKAVNEGVLSRQGHTEAGVDLMRLAGLKPAAVMCEIMNDDGRMARVPELKAFSGKHNLIFLTVADVLAYRQCHQVDVVKEVASANLPTNVFGNFDIKVFVDRFSGKEHLAILTKNFDSKKDQLVRIHSACATGDIFGSARCDCGHQLKQSLEKIQSSGGVLLYLNQEGRGIGLANKIKAYALQDQGVDTVTANHQLGFPADLRDYSIAAQMLKSLGLSEVRLLTNNPKKLNELEKLGITILSREALEVETNEYNRTYLKTKRDKLGHYITQISD